MGKGEIWYFAYGSNLNMGQMMTRMGEWTMSKKAVLKGYRLVFNVPSQRWGGCAANVIMTENPDDKVYGAVYCISEDKLNVLTGYEGVEPTEVSVEAEDTEISAKTYIFQHLRSSGKPSKAYIRCVLAGLTQHGYTSELLKEIRRIAGL